jgi:hypothetical protein
MSGALFEQWIERAEQALGLSRDDIGYVRGGQADLRMLTVAMQQTLWQMNEKRWRAITDAFGVVVVDEVQRAAASTVNEVSDRFSARYRIGISADECVAIGTLVRMGDGRELPIEDIRAGDSVMTPLGPKRVVAAIFKGLRQTVRVVVGDTEVRCTTNTWFGTRAGWLSYESVCYPFVYAKTLLGLPQADAFALCDPMAHALQTISVRRDGAVFDLLRAGTAGKGPQRAFNQPPRVDAVGEGQNERNRQAARQDFEGETARVEIGTYRSTARTRKGSDETRGTGESVSESDCDKACSIRAGGESSVRWYGEWRAATEVGDSSRVDVEAGWIQARNGRADGTGVSEPLQVRFRECSFEDCGGNRWKQSQFVEGENSRRAQGQASGGDRLGSSPFRGDERSLEAARGSLSVACADVERDWLTVPTFDLEVEDAACFFANNVLVHNSRKDKKEFLTHDVFGDVACEVKAAELVEQQLIYDVEVRMVPTDYDEPRYRHARDAGRHPDFSRLLGLITGDKARNECALESIMLAVAHGPTLVFSHRVEHCRVLDAACAARGWGSGLLLGGAEMASEFASTASALKLGAKRVGVGTIQAIGQGIDIPNVVAGVVVTPCHTNRQQWGQIKGRMCRASEGKSDAVVYYLFDRKLFGRSPIVNMLRWNQRVVVLDGNDWIDGNDYLKRMGRNHHATTQRTEPAVVGGDGDGDIEAAADRLEGIFGRSD